MIDIEEIIDRISDSFDCHKEYYDLSDSLIDDITKALEQQAELVKRNDFIFKISERATKETKKQQAENIKLAGTVENLAMELGKSDDLVKQLKNDIFESNSQLIKIAARLVRCDALIEFNNICENQITIGTHRLQYIVDKAENHLKDYAVAIRDALPKPPEDN